MNALFNSHAGFLASVLLAGLVAVPASAGDNDVPTPPSPPPPPPLPDQPQLFIRTMPSDDRQPGGREMTWLGVGVTETSEPLAAQLGLKPGEGLVVSFVSSNSPAATAGLQKNDVLVDLDGQMLVDGAQLEKLVQMHADGDTAKLTFFRTGSKQTASVKLSKQPLDATWGDTGDYQRAIKNFQLAFHDAQNSFNVDKQRLNIDMQQAMKQAQLAVQDALQQSLNGTDGLNHKLELLHKKLGNFADGGMNLNADSTVVVKNVSKSVRTVVKKDDTGTYVIVADPTKHLTAHDAQDKLLFDGTIESPEEQEKVPKDVWKAVKPMVDQLDQEHSPDTNKPATKEDLQEK